MRHNIFLAFFTLFYVVGCAAPDKQDTGPIVLTDPSQVMAHIGEVVTIRGVVPNTKALQIIGVDVGSSGYDLRGKMAEATGALHSWTVTKEQLEESDRLYGPIAHRGPGIFVRLKAVDSCYDAQAREVVP